MNRGASPVVAIPLLVGITVALVAVFGTTVFGMVDTPDPVDPALLDATATDDGRIVLVHEAGPTIDMTDVDVRIAVNGEALEYQPPVPFFAAKGFKSGPTGPFNYATDYEWEVGEAASLVIAGSNDPHPTLGDRVTVRLVRDGLPVARAETRVRAA